MATCQPAVEEWTRFARKNKRESLHPANINCLSSSQIWETFQSEAVHVRRSFPTKLETTLLAEKEITYTYVAESSTMVLRSVKREKEKKGRSFSVEYLPRCFPWGIQLFFPDRLKCYVARSWDPVIPCSHDFLLPLRRAIVPLFPPSHYRAILPHFQPAK